MYLTKLSMIYAFNIKKILAWQIKQRVQSVVLLLTALRYQLGGSVRLTIPDNILFTLYSPVSQGVKLSQHYRLQVNKTRTITDWLGFSKIYCSDHYAMLEMYTNHHHKYRHKGTPTEG